MEEEIEPTWVLISYTSPPIHRPPGSIFVHIFELTFFCPKMRPPYLLQWQMSENPFKTCTKIKPARKMFPEIYYD